MRPQSQTYIENVSSRARGSINNNGGPPQGSSVFLLVTLHVCRFAELESGIEVEHLTFHIQVS